LLCGLLAGGYDGSLVTASLHAAGALIGSGIDNFVYVKVGLYWPWYRVHGSCCSAGVEVLLNGTLVVVSTDNLYYSRDNWCALHAPSCLVCRCCWTATHSSPQDVLVPQPSMTCQAHALQDPTVERAHRQPQHVPLQGSRPDSGWRGAVRGRRGGWHLVRSGRYALLLSVLPAPPAGIASSIARGVALHIWTCCHRPSFCCRRYRPSFFLSAGWTAVRGLNRSWNSTPASRLSFFLRVQPAVGNSY
jgi:hypothetical protein